MKDIQLRELHRNTASYVDKEIVVRGWIRTNRSSNKFGFIELNDGTFFKSVQIVYEADRIANFDEVAKAPIASAWMRTLIPITHFRKRDIPWNSSERSRISDREATPSLQYSEYVLW